MGGVISISFPSQILPDRFLQGMNEHAIYEKVGTKRQRYVSTLSSYTEWVLTYMSNSPSIAGLRTTWCPEVVDLMERMWAHEHQDRPTISEVVEELESILHR